MTNYKWNANSLHASFGEKYLETREILRRKTLRAQEHSGLIQDQVLEIA